MLKRFLQMYVLVAAGLLVLDWFLLWARFYWFGFDGLTRSIYRIVNFPWSIFYFWIESKRNPWWYSIFGGRFEVLLNDEFGPLLIFLLVCLIQAAIFIALLAGFRKLRNRTDLKLMSKYIA